MKRFTKIGVAIMGLAMGTFISCENNVAVDEEIPGSKVEFTDPEGTLAESIEDGAILHCFCWSFNTIKANMKNIADAGFSAIQTSPVSKCRAGNDNNLTRPGTLGWENDAWYFHYQPTEYVVGNYQLGTEAEFKAMCKEAHKYGVKVIVDAVMNHCTMEYDFISNNIKKLASNPQQTLFHDMAYGMDLRDRYTSTQCHMNGLWEWNTKNKTVQDYHLKFLKQCVEDGADGFRYDAARCIELPDDDKYSNWNGFQSDFWPTILNNGSVFQYGECLQEGGNIVYNGSMKGGFDDSRDARLGAYQSQIFTTNGTKHNFFTTSSFYGWRLRERIVSRNLDVNYLKDFLLPSGASSQRVVTWVESHDNYCNDHTYTKLDEEDVILAYAILAGRKDGTPLFFDRPYGSYKGKHNHVEGDDGHEDIGAAFGTNKIGIAGSDMYKDKRVVAVNFFRNKMKDASETLLNPKNEKTLLMITRGDGGILIVNVSDTKWNITKADCPSSIKSGTYTDVLSGRKFTVDSNKITGTIDKRSVAVIYTK